MKKKEEKIVEKIIKDYQKKELTKLDELKSLDLKVKKPVKIFAYIFGIIGTLILGIGMCAAMDSLPSFIIKNISNSYLIIIGIVIGILGMVMLIMNYFIYQKLLSQRKNKYSQEIISLSEEILNIQK